MLKGIGIALGMLLVLGYMNFIQVSVIDWLFLYVVYLVLEFVWFVLKTTWEDYYEKNKKE